MMQDVVQSNSSTLHRAEVILSSEREYAEYLDSCMFLGSVTLLCSSTVYCRCTVSYFAVQFMVCSTLKMNSFSFREFYG
jgi:hypothetical protein